MTAVLYTLQNEIIKKIFKTRVKTFMRITAALNDFFDLIYFSLEGFGFALIGICTNRKKSLSIICFLHFVIRGERPVVEVQQ